MSATARDEALELVPGLVERVDASGRYGLVGSLCPDCGASAFPRAGCCPQCQGTPQRRVVGTAGSLYTYTVVRTRAPFGLPEPYAVGYVDLDESGLRVFGLIDPAAVDALAVGQRMEVGLDRLGVDGGGRPCLRPVFRPERMAADTGVGR
ncbi:MAG: OB-fold domain-containing protein [Azoarcus sp.]|nr:OB-fold domain-containing protein [Azoarcus sp.]